MTRFRSQLAETFAHIARLRPARAHPGSSSHFSSNSVDKVPLFGYVGARYRVGGVMFVARNGAIGKTGSDKEENRKTYRLTVKLQKSNAKERQQAFDDLMGHLYDSIQGWGTFKYVEEFLARTGLSFDEVSYINFVAFRSSDENLRAHIYGEAWAHYTGRLVEAIRPGFVVPLGGAAGYYMSRHYEGNAQVTGWIHRMRGDNAIPPEGRRDIKRAKSAFRRFKLGT